jgi:energy-coupling factor transport system ATP-binding protein
MSSVEPIKVHNLHVRYREAHALRGIDLYIAPGAFVLIGGPSGGGKSTLAHALLGLLSHEERPSLAEISGEVSVAGLDPMRHRVAQLATRAGLVFQNPATQLFNGTVEDEVGFGPRNLGLGPREVAHCVEYALEAAGCAHLRGRSVRHLSGGEQQLVAIAASLAMRPSVLILDEPTANLDKEGTRSLVRALVRLRRRSQVTLVVIEHRLEPFLRHADRLIWLDQGRVAADGSPDEARREEPVLCAVSHPVGRTGGEPGRATTSGRQSDRGRTLVSCIDVTAGYGGCAVLRDCSLTLRKGEFAALLGPNGAGKSTLARVLAGLVRPRRGNVVWRADGGAQVRVGLLQQNPLHQLVCQNVEEELRFGPRNLGTERDEDVEKLLARTNLLGLRARPTQALSTGEQQRAALAATLSLRPSLLILDEPTIGQDWCHLSRVMEFVSELNRQGQTVLLITHDHRLVDQYAHRVWKMADGKVRAAGTGDEPRGDAAER